MIIFENWQTITSDQKNLSIINEFETLPCEFCNRGEISFNEFEQNIVHELLQKIIQK